MTEQAARRCMAGHFATPDESKMRRIMTLLIALLSWRRLFISRFRAKIRIGRQERLIPRLCAPSKFLRRDSEIYGAGEQFGSLRWMHCVFFARRGLLLKRDFYKTTIPCTTIIRWRHDAVLFWKHCSSLQVSTTEPRRNVVTVQLCPCSNIQFLLIITSSSMPDNQCRSTPLYVNWDL